MMGGDVKKKRKDAHKKKKGEDSHQLTFSDFSLSAEPSFLSAEAFFREHDLLSEGHFFIAKDLVRLIEGQGSVLPEESAALRDLFLLLLLALDEGSLCLRTGEMEGLLLRSLTGVASARREASHENEAIHDARLLARQVEGCLERLRPFFGESPLLVLEESEGQRSLYFPEHHRSLECLRDVVQKHISHSVGSTETPESEEKAILDEVLHLRPVRRGGHRIELTAEQRLALLVGLRNSFFVLSGGPGTGKTTIILNLLRVLSRRGIHRIHLAAPTGKAAARMAESIRGGLAMITDPAEEDRALEQLQPVTLHRLLGIRPGREQPEFGTDHPIEGDLVVIDEVSMVDVVMMARLFRAVDFSRTRLILIGDRDQLPSVEAGAVLADVIRWLGVPEPVAYPKHLIEDAKRIFDDDLSDLPVTEATSECRFVLLTRSHRSESAVRRVATWANLGGRTANPLNACFAREIRQHWKEDAGVLLERKGASDLPSLLSAWMDLTFTDRYPDLIRSLSRREAPKTRTVTDKDTTEALDELFGYLSAARILTILRKGPAGSETLNRSCRQHLAGRLGASLRGQTFSGLPLLIRRNDPLRGLSNGDTGLVIEFRDRQALALFQSDKGYVAFTPDVLPLWEPAFVMTVHKSQGSEYDRVLLILPDGEDHPLMTRQIIYTGVTRARRLIAISGTSSALERAVQRDMKRLT